MRLLVIIFGVLLVSLAFGKSGKLGAALLAIVVLSLLLTANRKGVLT